MTLDDVEWAIRGEAASHRCTAKPSSASAPQPCGERIAEGDVVEVDLMLDEAPRVVSEPPDLAGALNDDPEARAGFDSLPYGLKRKEVASIEEAKSAEVRQRRIAKLVAKMRSDRA